MTGTTAQPAGTRSCPRGAVCLDGGTLVAAPATGPQPVDAARVNGGMIEVRAGAGEDG